MTQAKTCGLALCGGLCVLALALPVAGAEPVPLPEEEQAKVNKAIDRGVKYLKISREGGSTWAAPRGRYPVGHVALPALTLLECGVPASDAAIHKAAVFVRKTAPTLDWTYDLALAILFLDRLGDPKDKEVIQSCAARLIAGQAASGGWGYRCPSMTTRTQQDLLALLRLMEGPRPALEGVPAVGPKPGVDAAPPARPAAPRPAAEAPRAAAPKEIPKRFKGLAVFGDLDLIPLRDPVARNFVADDPTTDNSNTQFAILALWRAQRHDVPVTRTLHRMVRRFEESQNSDGTWGYFHGQPAVFDRPAMDCVGLLGLAVGHGMARAKDDKAPAGPIEDRRVLAGFVPVALHIGPDSPAFRVAGRVDYYFLWSVERVAVLYGLPTVGNKDWYRWGVKVLLDNQGTSGGWENGSYVGSSELANTCLALLFLKRVNLAADLTAKLPFKPEALNKSIALKAETAPPPSPGTSTAKEPTRP